MAINKITSRKFWNDVGLEARNRYRKEIFEKGRSVYGDKWWGGKYSFEYSMAKKSGTIKGSAEAFRNRVTPVLTSQLFKDFKGFLKPRHDGVQLGYPTFGERVAKLRRKGPTGTLTSSDQPLPNSVMKYIKDAYHNYVKKNQKNKTRYHRGKK